jgi:hypothetical protein
LPTLIQSAQLILSGIVPGYLTQQANDNIMFYFKPYELYPGFYLNYSLAEPIIIRQDGIVEAYFNVYPDYDPERG